MAAESLEMGAVDLVVSGVELEDLTGSLEMAVMVMVELATAESRFAVVGDGPLNLEVVDFCNGPTVVFEVNSVLTSLLETVRGVPASSISIFTTFEIK